MNRRSFAVAAVSLLLVAGCSGRRAQRAEPFREAARERAFTVLSINDVYRIEGVEGGREGGLARVRSLRRRLESEGGDLLFLHAGDLLYPSLLSRRYDGAHVIDVMNVLDGSVGRFDDRFFATFGNHEFDKAKLEEAALLDARVDESEFTWLGTNLVFSTDQNGQPLVGGDNLVPAAIRELGGIRVGLFSLTTDEKPADYIERFGPIAETARAAIATLREEGAEVVLALTHLTLAEDLELLAALGDDGPDAVFGGHEHEQHAEQRGGRWVVKADAEARTATVARITLDPGGNLSMTHEWVPLRGGDPPPDPMVSRRVSDWLARFDQEYCVGKLKLETGCLDDVLGRTQMLLEGEELTIRRYESSLGNWVADRMLAAFASQRAQIAFVNSGSLRLNQDLPAGSAVKRAHIEELLAYPAGLRLIEIDGATLEQVVSRSVATWTGNGWWLQIAGFAFRHDPDAQSATDLTLLTTAGPRRIAPDDRLKAVTVDFLIEPSGGQDGYIMLGPHQVIAEGPDLKDLVFEALQTAGDEGIAPSVEGRICNPRRQGPCLALTPPGTD